MVRHGKHPGRTPNRKYKRRSDSDEDYVVETEENLSDDNLDDIGKLSGCYVSKEKSVCFHGSGEEEEEGFRKVVKPKKINGSFVAKSHNTGRISRKRKSKKKVLYADDDEEEDDESYNEDEESDEEFTLRENDDYQEEDGQLMKKKKKDVGARSGIMWDRKSRVSKESVIKRRNKYKLRKKKNLDNEYTISEEEREQVKEARMFCGLIETRLRSSSRVDTEVEDRENLFIHEKESSRRKGKSRIEEEEEENSVSGKFVCGICLLEDDKRSPRGTLSCCDHHFCFACIMEWSKIESRCPLCKKRFKTVTKNWRSTPTPSLRNIEIRIPIRDQIYEPSEEEIRSFFNPYQNMTCMECHDGRDDDLMLLCDTCDSPAHTYCVGLGWQVPDGNWYCDACSLVSSTDGGIPKNPEGSENLFSARVLRGDAHLVSPPSSTLSARRQRYCHVWNLINVNRENRNGDLHRELHGDNLSLI